MKIMLLTGEYPPQPGGIGDYTRRLGQALRGGGQVEVLTIQGGRLIVYTSPVDDDNCNHLDEQIFISRQARCDWSPRCWPAVLAALAERRPDWLHIQYQTGAYAMRAGVNLLPWRLRRLRRRPRVAVTFHDLLEPYLFPKAGPLRRWVNLRLARDADAVVTTNAADAATLARAGLRPASIPIGSNIPVAPPAGYRRETWRAERGIARATLLVAYFGLLSASKGVDLLLEALAGLPAQIPWRLLVIGGAATAPQDIAYAAEVRAQIVRGGLGGRVDLTGQIAPAQVSAHLLAADLVALPFRDGASFRRGSLLAALAHGCPVITTTPADADAAGLLHDSAEAMLVPAGSAPALRAALERLASDPALRARLGATGRVLVDRFAWPTIAAQHHMLYAAEAV